MAWLLLLHKTTVFLTLISFFVRGIGHMFEKPWVNKKPVKILPHIIDTLLLVSAIGLVIMGPWGFSEPWIMAKLIGLVLYIALGVMAFKIAKTKKQKGLYWILALIALFYMIAVSKTKLIWPFIA